MLPSGRASSADLRTFFIPLWCTSSLGGLHWLFSIPFPPKSIRQLLCLLWWPRRLTSMYYITWAPMTLATSVLWAMEILNDQQGEERKMGAFNSLCSCPHLSFFWQGLPVCHLMLHLPYLTRLGEHIPSLCCLGPG